LGAVSTFRQVAEAVGATSLHLARQRLPSDYQAMLDLVEATVAAQPLPRLQAVGSAETTFPFIYDLDWGPRETFSAARLRRDGPHGPAIRLRPGAGDELIRLGPLVRPLVEVHWTRMVAEINGVAKAELDLHRHLFGADRLIPPEPLRDGIAALQADRCFYCRGSLGARPEADHFIPRVRRGVDAVENLVLADRACNNDKRDLLPGPPLAAAWARRIEHHVDRLAQLATASRWDTDPQATAAVARSIYSHLPQGGIPLWLGIRNVGKEDSAAVLAALAEASRPDGRLAGAPRLQNFGTYLAQRAARSRLQPVSAGHSDAAPASPRAVDGQGSDDIRPGQSRNEHVRAWVGYHARVSRRCSSVGRAAVL
jgi:HNH endonuclease